MPSYISNVNITQAQANVTQTPPLTTSQQENFKSDGFTLPASFSADGTGLPYDKVPSYRDAQLKRNIITWFVPEFGVVRMYVNPQSIQYQHKKLIHKDRTKGGFTLQYWGEDLSTLNISGTTGSAGIEGINVLYEIYRAEQYAFDTTGLVIDANNASQNLASNALNGIGNAIGGSLGSTLFGGASTGSSGTALQNTGLVGGVLGLNNPSNSLASNNFTSLAQLAFTVEMYYNGWVFRGFFENMTMTEKATDFLWDYQMTFTVTQKRGYRENYFPWSKSAKDGPSQYTTPQSFSGNTSVGR